MSEVVVETQGQLLAVLDQISDEDRRADRPAPHAIAAHPSSPPMADAMCPACGEQSSVTFTREEEGSPTGSSRTRWNSPRWWTRVAARPARSSSPTGARRRRVIVLSRSTSRIARSCPDVVCGSGEATRASQAGPPRRAET